MKRLLFALCILLLCATALTGCHQPKDNSSYPQQPERVAVLFSSLAQIWQEAGGTVSITVGESVERGFVSDDIPLVDSGAGKNIHTELLLSYEPDLVIASADIPAQMETASILEKAGIPVLLCHVESFADYLDVLTQMTALTGDETGLTEALDMQASIDTLLTEAKSQDPLRILFIRAGSTASATKAKTASDHFACAMLAELGCINIADQVPVLFEGLSMEEILLADPDYIFFSLMGEETSARAHVENLLSGDVWGRLTAVQMGRAIVLPRELFHFKPCNRWAEAYQYLADVLFDREEGDIS